jgi:hypothetical protein
MKASCKEDEPVLTNICAASVKAREHADAVDRDARFPVEAMDMLRNSGALGQHVRVGKRTKSSAGRQRRIAADGDELTLTASLNSA